MRLRSAALLALFVPAHAFAVAHHEQVVIEKLRDPATKALVGFRLHAIVDPEGYDHFRLNLGKMAIDAAATATAMNDARHRRIAAGLEPGYVRATIAEMQNLPKKATGYGHELQELKLDVKYGDMNDLKPGDKVDVFSAFNGASNLPYWHVFGMFYGPVNKGDNTYVHELPTETSAHAEAK